MVHTIKLNFYVNKVNRANLTAVQMMTETKKTKTTKNNWLTDNWIDLKVLKIEMCPVLLVSSMEESSIVSFNERQKDHRTDIHLPYKKKLSHFCTNIKIIRITEIVVRISFRKTNLSFFCIGVNVFQSRNERRFEKQSRVTQVLIAQIYIKCNKNGQNRLCLCYIIR